MNYPKIGIRPIIDGRLGGVRGIYAVINTILSAIVVMELGWVSVIALFSSYFFMLLMFPTIFSRGIWGLGPLTKKAFSFLVMAVAGGAFCPPIMGTIADHFGMPIAFFIPLACFAFITWHAFLAAVCIQKFMIQIVLRKQFFILIK